MSVDSAEHDVVRYSVTGMDCASCAAKIERAVAKLPGIDEVRVSIASQLMTLRLGQASDQLYEVERVVEGLGYHLQRVRAPLSNPEHGDSDAIQKDLSPITPGYRRALWTVILLNVGYGLVEVVAGFIARSQALQADALDFFGDGLITFLGLLAIGWSLAWRARAALIQGLFLAALGVAVLVGTAYKVIVLNEPQAEMMGLFGAIALVINVLAALVLIPHRSGDANARAVWLFSRNDAIGNLAVVVAAGLVAWTKTPWPDLAVAVVIAGLFLQSAWSIIRHARSDLRDAAVAVVLVRP